MVQLPQEFRATLDSYQGPLDLLLYLIKKEEVDILDIPIGRITEQYRAHVSILQRIDPNVCGEFLVMAAHLMEIKSRSLLPTEPPLSGEEMEDPRMELVRQLLEYKKYKERALLLARRIEEHGRRFHRPGLLVPAEPEEELQGPLDIGNVSVWDLLSAFHRIQLAIGERGPHRVVFSDRPMEEYIAYIQEKAEDSPDHRLAFEEVFAGCRDIYDAIGYFLAILEMARRRLLTLHQEELFGPIEIFCLKAPPDEVEPAAGSSTAEASPPAPGEEGTSRGIPPTA